jgi:hypothetical protein
VLIQKGLEAFEQEEGEAVPRRGPAMSRRVRWKNRGGRPATATRGAGRVRRVQRQIETKSAPVGWDRPPLRPLSSCPVCWADITYLAGVDVCHTMQRRAERRSR